jgi:hypothetical protein
VVDKSDAQSCGPGLAAGAELPDALSRLLAARAEVLERHTKALDENDPLARRELDAYREVVRRHRAVVAELQALAERMRACRDLPACAHHMDELMAPDGQMAAFREYVEIERDVIKLLTAHLEADQDLLG